MYDLLRMGWLNIPQFYHILLQHKTMTGPGHWFAMPNRYMRIGFDWPDKKALEQGLINVSKATEESTL